MLSQRGNTLGGFLLGLLLGLAIAVAVALFINRTASPFTNKSGKIDKTEEAASTPLADPNKPLYGNKDAAHEANKELAKNAEAPKTAIAPLPDAPRADAAADKGKDKVTDTPRSEEKANAFLQVGAYRDQAEAENLRARLALLGFEGRISEKPAEGGTLYRVRIGPFAQTEAMNRIKGKLSENGIESSVVPAAK